MSMDEKYFYSIGYKNAIASVLAKYNNKIKLPELAEQYKQEFQEHCSHQWHTS